RRRAAEVCEGSDDLAVELMASRVVPVKDSRESLAGKLGERRRLMPADAADRVLGLPGRIRSKLPHRRTGTACLVREARDGVTKRPRDAVDDKRRLPVFRIPVAAGVHEALEFTIRHFVLVDPETGQLDDRRSFL